MLSRTVVTLQRRDAVVRLGLRRRSYKGSVRAVRRVLEWELQSVRESVDACVLYSSALRALERIDRAFASVWNRGCCGSEHCESCCE